MNEQNMKVKIGLNTVRAGFHIIVGCLRYTSDASVMHRGSIADERFLIPYWPLYVGPNSTSALITSGKKLV